MGFFKKIAEGIKKTTDSIAKKLFYAFSSSSVSIDDGIKAAQCLYTWAGMMGLEDIPYSIFVHKEGEIMPISREIFCGISVFS